MGFELRYCPVNVSEIPNPKVVASTFFSNLPFNAVPFVILKAKRSRKNGKENYGDLKENAGSSTGKTAERATKCSYDCFGRL
jgi:hypothetical protein